MAGGIAQLLGREDEKKARREAANRRALNPAPRTCGFLELTWKKQRPAFLEQADRKV